MKQKIIQFFKRKISRSVRGDTILEVMVATAILSTIMIATFDILQRAIDTNLNVKNRVIALNIGREGLEAVRNIRDTNWLKYSGDRRQKWLCHDTAASPDNCQGTANDVDMINDNDDSNRRFYSVDFDNDPSHRRYYLGGGTNATHLQNVFDFSIAQSNREAYRLYLTPTAPQRYTHESVGNIQTPFYRQVLLDIENPYDAPAVTIPTFCNNDDPDCVKSRLRVVVRVYWQEDGRQRTVTLQTYLYDFFERDDY